MRLVLIHATNTKFAMQWQVEVLIADEGVGVGPGPLAMARRLMQGEYAAVVLEVRSCLLYMTPASVRL